MSKVYLSTTVNDDGSMNIPNFAVRGLGYKPGDKVNITLPVAQSICECNASELFLSRCCAESECSGYTSDSEELNIPTQLLCDAMVPVGSRISIISADQTLVIVVTEEASEELAMELSCCLDELGIITASIRTPSIFHCWEEDK